MMVTKKGVAKKVDAASFHDVRRSGSAALDLCWVACGRVEGFWEFKLNPWDVAAGMLIVEEAGGRVTDFSNQGWRSLPRFGKETLATNGRVHGEMLRVIRQTLLKAGRQGNSMGGA